MLRRRTRPIFKQPPRRLPELRHLLLALLLAMTLPARAEAPAPVQGDGTMLVSLFLPPGEAATPERITTKLVQEGVLEELLPQGLGIESWYAMPGFGQFLTLRLPPSARLSAAAEPGRGGQRIVGR